MKIKPIILILIVLAGINALIVHGEIKSYFSLELNESDEKVDLLRIGIVNIDESETKMFVDERQKIYSVIITDFNDMQLFKENFSFVAGREIAVDSIDPKNGEIDSNIKNVFVKSSDIVINVPYYTNGNNILILDNENKKTYSIDVSRYAKDKRKMNIEDKVDENKRQEVEQKIQDERKLIEENVRKEINRRIVLSIMLVIVVVLIIILVIYLFLDNRKKKKG